MKTKIYILLNLLLIITLSVLSGCAFVTTTETTEKTKSNVPDYSNKSGQLGFMTYSVPLPTDEQFQLFKEAGLRTMLMSGEYLGFYQGKTTVRDGVDLDTFESFFKLAEKYGIGILDFSMDVSSIVNSRERQEIYAKYPDVLKGFFIGDEPGVTAIDDMAKRIDWVNTNYPGLTYTTTLHPSWAPVNEELDEGQGKVNNIQEYYEYMINTVLNEMSGPKILCADDYPCKRYGYDGDNFLKTLAYMSQAAIDNPKIIKQMCLNCSTFREVNESPGENARPVKEWQGAYEKVVTEMEIRMPAITSMAFGYTSFLYFMYGPFPHSDEMVIEREGLDIKKNISPINYVGPNEVEVTEYYDYIKKTNLELESFENCFTAFKWKGTKMIPQSNTYDTTAAIINSMFEEPIKSFTELTKIETSGDADVMIGYFKEGKSREGYFISNFCGYSDEGYRRNNNLPVRDENYIRYDAYSFEYDKNATVSLTFADYDTVYIVKNGVTITDQKLVKHVLSEELKPGDYMFVIPY